MRHLTFAPLLAVSCVVAVLPAQSAAAAPPLQADHSAPYSSADGSMWQECTAGATCTGTASADGLSGVGSASVAYDRAAATTGKEQVSATSRFLQTVRVPRGTRAATVTVTWRIASASASATSTRGRMFADSSLTATVQCGDGCVSTRGVQQVAIACSEQGVTTCHSTPGEDISSVQGVDLTVTTTVRDLKKSSFDVVTYASASVLAGPLCGASASPSQPLPLTEDCSTTIDEEHGGTGASDLDARLVSIHVEPSSSAAAPRTSAAARWPERTAPSM